MLSPPALSIGPSRSLAQNGADSPAKTRTKNVHGWPAQAAIAFSIAAVTMGPSLTGWMLAQLRLRTKPAIASASGPVGGPWRSMTPISRFTGW